MNRQPRRRRRRAKVCPGTVNHFPTAPGWWVQWCGRTDWHPMSEVAAKAVARMIVSEGDRVVHVEKNGGDTEVKV